MVTRKKKQWKRIVWGSMCILGVIMFIPSAEAEQPFDITCCYSGKLTMVSQSKELRVLGGEAQGISQSNHENKAFDNMTLHYMFIMRITDGKEFATAYIKGMDPDGDTFVQEQTRVGLEVTCKFLEGTGKWKGIKGGGTGKIITRGKPITPGTTQGCYRMIGTFELPK